MNHDRDSPKHQKTQIRAPSRSACRRSTMRVPKAPFRPEADRLAIGEVGAARRARRAGRDPWTDPDPQPGDFDADLTDVNPRYVEAHPANPTRS
jgi:hypothetical protein